MTTVPLTTPLPIVESMSEGNLTNSDTDLSVINTEDEINTNVSSWTEAERKKLQHMTEFHQEYQRVFGEHASLHNIIKKRITHMNPPIPESLCEEEMQNLDSNEVIIEYMTDAYGNKIKKLKPLLIKSEPNRNYVQHVPSDDDLPAIPESHFTQKQEITVDSYSESISSNEDSSEDRTITANRDSSAAQSFEDISYKLETDSKEIENTLHQIATGLCNDAEGYLILASHISNLAPYELP